MASEYFPETLFGISRGEGAVTFTIYVLSMLFVSVYGKADKKLLLIAGVSTLLFCFIVILQLLGHNPLNLYPVGYNYYDANKQYFGQFVGTIGNVDLVSAYLCPMTAAMITAFYKCRGKLKIFCIVTALVCLFIMFKINVKSGYVGLGAGLLFSLPMQLNIRNADRKKLAGSIFGAIVLGVVFVFAVDVGSGMFHEVHQLMHGNINPNFGTGRIKIWTALLKLIPSKIFLGYGPDTMLMANIEPWVNYLAQYDAYVKAYIDTAHNEYLNILYHQGIFALLTFIGTILSVLISTIKQDDFSVKKIILWVFVLTFGIQAFFNVNSCMSSIYFYIVLGLLCKETLMKQNIKETQKTVLLSINKSCHQQRNCKVHKSSISTSQPIIPSKY